MNKLYSKEIFRKMNKNGVSNGYYYFIIMWADGFCQDVTHECLFRNTIKHRWSKKYNALIAYTVQDVLNGLKTWMNDCGVKYCGSL